MTLQRIAIVGPGGSGKTTLADRLAERLAVPALHLDEHLFIGRQISAEAEQRRKVAQLLSGDVWIVEGAAWRLLDLLFGHATTVVILDAPFRRTFPRLVRRELRIAWHGWSSQTAKALFHLRHPLLWAPYYPLVERRRVLRAAHAVSASTQVIIANTVADAVRQIELATR